MTELVKREGREIRLAGPFRGDGAPVQVRPLHPHGVDADEIDLRQILTVLLKRKWQILLIAAAVLLPVAGYTFLATPIYRSTVSVQIDPESAQVLPYKEIGETAVSNFDMYLRTQFEILQSPTLASRVIGRLDLLDNPLFNAEQGLSVGIPGWAFFWSRASEGPPPTREERLVAAERRFLSNLEVRPIRASRLVEISYAAPDAAFAAQVVNVLAEEFMKRHFEKKYETTEKATDFLETQLGILKVKVEEAERELIQYARQHSILNLEHQETDVIRQRLDDLNRRLTVVEGNYFAKRAAYTSLAEAAAGELPERLKTQTIITLEARQHELGQRLANLSSTFGENWPEVVQTRRELEQVEAQLSAARQETLAEAREQARLDFASARQEFELLTGAMDQQKMAVDRLNEASIQYNILQREVHTNKELYQGLLQRLRETGVTAGLEFGNVQLVNHGRVERSPFRPRRALNLALGLILGLTLGCGAAFLLEYLDDSVRTPDELERQGLPSLAVIPRIEQKRLAAGPSSKADGKASAGSSVLSLARTENGLGGYAIAPMNRANWKTWEAFRNLRTSVLLSKGDSAPRKVLVTSSVPKEGKTTTVAHLGVLMAQSGVRTVVVDLDMRKPSLGGLFGLNGRQPGMSLYLSGHSELIPIVRETAISNLYVVPSGPKPPNPSELLSSERIQEMFQVLSKHFQFILVDSPPVLTVTDPQVLAPRVDGVILVVKAGTTPRDVVRRAQQLLDRVGARILGASINAVDLGSPDYRYYGQYYYDESYRS